ncbi:amidohydrolase [Sporofaciens sp. SGI.106]|uniref:amidohydrolase n=1 Tax=Sporofaciens sp. SGI.106 TaxID=3420568 RepID=UPI002A954101|nr:amidohydrolase [Lachnoclostridium sp.]
MDKSRVVHYLEERASDFYSLSDKIWENAEIRFQEKQSVQDYVAFLENEGFSVTVGLAGLKTAFCAQWGSGKPVIGFLGEYDALPGLSQKAGVAEKESAEGNGNGHGCGHNLLGVGALMGAVGFKHYLETEGKSGTVVYFGCPAEEGGSGKTFMAREGCFNQLDVALSWHPNDLNMMPPGPVLANDSIRYSFTGKASHAAAAPEAGRSALDALELMNIGVQFLREHIPSTARIHYAITDTGGISPNIVQAQASALYQIRAPFAPELADLYERVNNIARGAALMTDTKVTIKFLKGTSNTVLIPALDEVMYNNMCEIPNPVEGAEDMAFALEIVKTQKAADTIIENAFNIKPMPWNKAGNMPLAGSSDVGDVSWVCPVSQCGTSTWPIGTAAHSWQAVACGKSDFAHRGMLYAGQIIAATAIDICDNPEIIETAWKQLRDKTGNQPYHCPIPPEITPDLLEAETT